MSWLDAAAYAPPALTNGVRLPPTMTALRSDAPGDWGMGAPRLSEVCGKFPALTVAGTRSFGYPRCMTTSVDGRATRWAQHNAERRRELVEATLRAIRKHGHGIGMDDLAADAGTSKTVFYRHFGDRTGLYTAVVESVQEFILGNVTGPLAAELPPARLVTELADAYLAVVEADGEIYRFVANRPGDSPRPGARHHQPHRRRGGGGLPPPGWSPQRASTPPPPTPGATASSASSGPSPTGGSSPTCGVRAPTSSRSSPASSPRPSPTADPPRAHRPDEGVLTTMTLTADAPQTNQAAPAASGRVTATGEALRKALDGPFHDVKQRWRTEVTAEDVVRDPALGTIPRPASGRWRSSSARRPRLAIAGLPRRVRGAPARRPSRWPTSRCSPWAT